MEIHGPEEAGMVTGPDDAGGASEETGTDTGRDTDVRWNSDENCNTWA
jgi:hypothetical protein